MSAEFIRLYNTGTHVYIPMIKRNVVDFAVSGDWTPVAGDVKVSKDGGAAANIGTLPSAIAMGNGAMWDFTLSASEMSAKKIAVTVVDAATKAVEDQMFTVATYGNASAELPGQTVDANLTQILATVLTETITGQLAGGFKKWFDVTAPTGTLLAFDANNRVKALVGVQKNTALNNFEFVMTDSTNHVPTTGATITAQKSIDGGALGACTNSASSVSNGVYKINLSAADLNGSVITLRFTATGFDDRILTIYTSQ